MCLQFFEFKMNNKIYKKKGRESKFVLWEIKIKKKKLSCTSGTKKVGKKYNL